MIDFNEAYNVAVYRPDGPLDNEVAIRLLDFLLAMENARLEPFHRLVDLTAVVEIRLTGKDLYRISEQRRIATAKSSPCRSAILAPSTSSYGIGQIYQGLMAGSNIEVGVFRDMKSVADWLRVPEAGLSYRKQDVEEI